MKIVLLIDSLTQGGAQRQIVGLAKLLREKEYSIVSLTYHDIPFYAPFLDKYNITHQVIEGAKNPVRRIWRVRQALKHEKPDVVISYLDMPNMLACIAKILGVKAKLIVSERNTTQHLSKKEKLKFFLYRWADYVVPNSMSQANFITKYFQGLSSKVATISNFVDLDSFKPLERKSQNKRLNIIGAGRIEPQKNILRLIQAVAIAKEKGYDLRVDWYGRKSYGFIRYEQAVKDNKLEDIFFFQEPTNDIVSKYQQSDLFCLPSLYEGYPNVLCEAMACGLPVICGNICDNPYIMEDRKNGFLFNPCDVNSIVDAIISFYNLAQLEKNRFGEASRKLAEEKFSEETFIEKYLSVIR